MSTFQQNSTTTTYNDGSQIKTTEFSKKNVVPENTDLSKPEFGDYRPIHNETQTTYAASQPAIGASTATTTSSTTGPSTTEQLKAKATVLGHQIGDAITAAGEKIHSAVNRSSASNTTNTTVPSQQQYNTVTPATYSASTVPVGTTTTTTTATTQPQQQGGLGAKLSDMMSHVGAALHHGHPVHAVSNASTAAKIGECERAKHEQGPLADSAAGTTQSSSLDNPNFNAAGQPYENTSSAALNHTNTNFNNTTGYNAPSYGSDLSSRPIGATTQTTTYATSQPLQSQSTTTTTGLGHQSDHLGYTTGDKMRDMASHASAQLSHGNPITALADAPAAARIAEAEKLKHEKGPVSNADLNTQSSYNQTGSVGGVTGISGQTGASSTLPSSSLPRY